MANPYLEDELKRTTQVGLLKGGTSNTMPIGGAPQIMPVQPVREAPSAAQIFEGFDRQRPQDIKKSAKDAFAHFSDLAPVAPIHDKAALGQWFEQFVRPGFEAQGHKVSNVTGDKFQYGNHEGNFIVDYGLRAGAPGGALGWLAEPADEATRQRYPGSGGGARQPSGMNPVMDNSALTRIMAEITAASNDEQSPAEREAILQLLQGGLTR